MILKRRSNSKKASKGSLPSNPLQKVIDPNHNHHCCLQLKQVLEQSVAQQAAE